MDQMMVGQRGPALEILRLIQQQGPQSIKSLSAALDVTATAVREQVQQLQAQGLLNMAKRRTGAGRPAHLYSLSTKAQSLFPQSYDVVLKLLLEEIVRVDGADRAQQLLNAVGDRLADEVVGPGQSVSLRDQLQKVAAELHRRGMPIVIVEEADEVALHEWSCPFLSLAREHDGVCAMEQRMLERALGAKVTIAERMLDGHAGCKFMVDGRPSHQRTQEEVNAISSS